jgi:hypothetical protein
MMFISFKRHNIAFYLDKGTCGGDNCSMKRSITPKVTEACAEIGASLRTWRILYELKAVQVAERAGISIGTLRKIEQGDPSVGMDAFMEVARSLGLLGKLTESLDPLNSDLGRARVTDNMPKRIRG